MSLSDNFRSTNPSQGVKAVHNYGCRPFLSGAMGFNDHYVAIYLRHSFDAPSVRIYLNQHTIMIATAMSSGMSSVFVPPVHHQTPPSDERSASSVSSNSNDSLTPTTSKSNFDKVTLAPDAKCAVCGDAAHGMHFGVSACRACAAFFRRSTISSRTYVCRFGGNCDIGKDVRCCCRACRMAKCLSLGMKTDAVQRHRDNIGPRKRNADSFDGNSDNEGGANPKFPSRGNSLDYASPDDGTNSNPTASGDPLSTFPGLNHSLPMISTPPSVGATTTSSANGTFCDNGKTYTMLKPVTTTATMDNFESSTVGLQLLRPMTIGFTVGQPIGPEGPSHLTEHEIYAKLNLPCSNPVPLLSEISRGYKKLCNLRRTTCRLREGVGLMKLFEENFEIREGTYDESIATIKSDLSLVSEMISDHFVPLARFSVESKWLLLRNFFGSFLIAEHGVNTARVFPKIDDPRVLFSYRHYANIDNLNRFFTVPACKSEPVEVATIFQKLFIKFRALVYNVMRELDLSDDEVAGILGALFWSQNLEGLNREEDQLAREAREAIFDELYYACRCRVGGFDELGTRFGRICNLIPIIKRSSLELTDSFSVVNILNIFDIDTFIHKIMPHSF
uniref:Nuclear receptor domain-containing protein n=1 Tax=Panagrellus redivivus TaxID=6233 RepID=A0A7E4V5F2_PANRE